MCFPTTSTNILSRPGVPAMPNRCASTLQACRKTQWKPTFYELLFFLFCLPIFPAHLLFCCRFLAGFRVGGPFRLMNCAFILFGYASFQRHFCFAFPSTPHTSCRSGTSSSHGFLFTQSSMCSRDCGVGLNLCFWRRYANNIFIQERFRRPLRLDPSQTCHFVVCQLCTQTKGQWHPIWLQFHHACQILRMLRRSS